MSDPRKHIKKHWLDNPITNETKHNRKTTITAQKWLDFSWWLVHCLGIKINMIVLENALSSSLFLDYDGATGAYVQSSAYEAIFKLVEKIRWFNRDATNENLSLIFDYSPRSIGHPAGDIDLPTAKLIALYALALRWANILSLSIALIKHLEGKPFAMPELMPFSPIYGMEEAIAAEKVTAEETRAFIGI